jgi:hypothetical protein
LESSQPLCLSNDDPFADDLAKSLAGNVGFAMGAAMAWPLLFLWALAKRWRTRPSGRSGV